MPVIILLLGEVTTLLLFSLYEPRQTSMLYWRRPFRLWILTATVLLVLVIVSVVVHVPITIEWSARDKNGKFASKWTYWYTGASKASFP